MTSSSLPDSPAATAKDHPVTTVVDIVRMNPQFYSLKGLARVAIGGWFLGVCLSAGLMFVFGFDDLSLRAWGLYMTSLAIFHSCEFILTALFHPESVSFQSFLLNHSKQYHIALAASILEFWIERTFVPHIKQYSVCIVIGVLLSWGGQYLRSLSMYIAGKNFTHVIAERKKESHVLVRDGVYAWCRHPSYCGWFWWSVGTQLLLCNPVCTLAYTVVSWRFFKERIPYEEETLIRFFGDEYLEYRRTTTSGVPFVA